MRCLQVVEHPLKEYGVHVSQNAFVFDQVQPLFYRLHSTEDRRLIFSLLTLP